LLALIFFGDEPPKAELWFVALIMLGFIVVFGIAAVAVLISAVGLLVRAARGSCSKADAASLRAQSRAPKPWYVWVFFLGAASGALGTCLSFLSAVSVLPWQP
jgi:hypothetical protein